MFGGDLYALRCTQGSEAFWRLEQLRLEATDAKPDQGCLHAVDDTGAFTNQAFSLTAWALGVLLLKGRDCHHLAMPGLPT
jgi:hypothetical protein